MLTETEKTAERRKKAMRDRIILHSDCNCFYASVEHLHRPELEGKPVAVGGNPEERHGIILTADYTAKRCGVKVGMAHWQARKACPELIILPPRMDLYLRFSKLAGEIYAEYTDRVEPFGIDESWLDVTESVALHGDGMKVAGEISNRIKRELGITVSIGVSFNKIFAKLGSDMKKPDGITRILREEYREKIWPLPAGDLLMVGRSTESKLRRLGIRTIGELACAEERILEAHFGKMGGIIRAFANGYDESPVKREHTAAPIKSIGNSTTTFRPLETKEDIKLMMYVLAESVGARLRENGFQCRVVEVWLRDEDLHSFTRQRKLLSATDDTEEIAEEAFRLFEENCDLHRAIRSIGVRGSDLITGEEAQLQLFVDYEKKEKRRKADRMADYVRKRFGYHSIQRGLMYCDKALSALDAKSEHSAYPRSYF